MSVSGQIAGQHTFTISFTSNNWTQPVLFSKKKKKLDPTCHGLFSTPMQTFFK